MNGQNNQIQICISYYLFHMKYILLNWFCFVCCICSWKKSNIKKKIIKPLWKWYGNNSKHQLFICAFYNKFNIWIIVEYVYYRYHCHDCKMVEGVGVCTVCAKVCHKGHDLTYAKFGSFFCDCGAKDDNSCKVGTRWILCKVTWFL